MAEPIESPESVYDFDPGPDGVQVLVSDAIDLDTPGMVIRTVDDTGETYAGRCALFAAIIAFATRQRRLDAP